MSVALVGARVAVGGAALAIAALAALHLLKPEIDPRRTMISQYALGRYGWLMGVCLASFALGSGGAAVGLSHRSLSLPGRAGVLLLAFAALALVVAALCPMDPVSTPRPRTFTGRMHGVAFLIGVPSQLIAVLLLSMAVENRTLLAIAAVVWVSFAAMLAVMLIVGPGKALNPDGPERFLGVPNRLFMIAYGVWLIVAALPRAS